MSGDRYVLDSAGVRTLNATIARVRNLPGNPLNLNSRHRQVMTEATGGNNEYNGYFKIIDASTYNDDGTLAEARIRIIDGATYDDETGTSGKGICKVNNATFQVEPYQSGVIVSTCTFALKYTAPIAADESAGIEQQDAKIEVVNLLDEGVEFLPSDTSINCWYQIGRAIISTKADGTMSINVQQDHQGTATNGIPQIWWYALCEE